MKIGLVTTWADCGAGHVSLAYARELSRLGCQVEIYSRGQYLRSQRWGVSECRPWPLELDQSVSGLTRVNPRQFAAWIKRFAPDWLIFNEQRAWAPVLQARAVGVRCAAYVDYYRADTVDLFRLYDLLLCHTCRHFSAFAADPRARLIPWGVDTDHFSPGARQLTGAENHRPLVVIHSAGMGGPSDRKGTDLALHAFSAVKGEAEFLMHTQLPRSQWPEEWVKAVSADSRIKVWEGSVDPVELYRAGDLYLYPSRLEGIGLTLPEALACGLSAITTDCAPMNEFVTHDVNGSLVPVSQFRARSDGYYWPESWVDPSALTLCLQRYVQNPKLARRQGHQARAVMLAERRWPIQAKSIYACLATESRRIIDADTWLHLRKLAHFQDRSSEPTALDGLMLAARCAVGGLKRRWGGAC